MFPFAVVASCVPRMNKNPTSSRSFTVVKVGDDLETIPEFLVVRLEVSQSRYSRRDVSAARTFHNHDAFPVLDMFEARRTVPVADSSEGWCHPFEACRLEWVKACTYSPSRHSSVIQAFNAGHGGIQTDHRSALFQESILYGGCSFRQPLKICELSAIDG